MSDDPAVEAWIERARSADILEVATIIGAQLKRAGGEWAGPCPRCNGTDRFSINPHEQVFNCRGAEGGDVVQMVVHAANPSADTPFMEAVEIINGCPPPDRESRVRQIDPEIIRERQEERKDQELARVDAAAEKRETNAAKAQRMFDAMQPLPGTQGDAYFRRRGIFIPAEMAGDLRYSASLEYKGYFDLQAEDEISLGRFPCVVSAIRDVADRIIGIHRTYLDPNSPAKLKPPGDRSRNKSKKTLYDVMGGAIRLGPVRRAMAAGEGLETTLSWYQLGVGPDDIGVMCAVNLGNLSGEAMGRQKHPAGLPDILNGIPNPDKPGMLIPPGVEELILLGDRDPDLPKINARLLTAGRRHRANGLSVSIHMPDLLPDAQKTDWSDVLMAQARRAA